ncbi:MAG: hypothetical protein EPN94_10720 [Nitrospirae bacterium]|nr:MAG: hypothetical protein EPN94_10720 [Nitrospirota bacterium]
MEEKWYEGLGEDAFLKEEDREYKNILEKIKAAVESGMGFDEACRTAGIENHKFKDEIGDDGLKFLIAEMHFMKKMPTDKVAEALKISLERVNAARESMLKEVEESAINAFHKDTGSEEA